MVNIRSELPRLEDGQPNVDAWLMNLAHSEDLDCERLARAAALCRGHARILEFGVDLAQLSRELQLDSDSLAAALVYPALGAGIVDFDTVRANIGDAATELVANVIKLTPVGAFELSTSPLLASESADQVDNVQNMLVSMIDDPRVAVMKLAERVVALRLVKNESESLQRQMAEEAQSVFAPLANRLGIWQVKWGLEDLAFRYLRPEDYKSIASLLDGRREERELYVAKLVADVSWRLDNAGFNVEVQGRAKHIYSIWRKMREKGIEFSQVYDVQAVRVLVDEIPDCYAALGIVHTSWPHIRSEFDDYIANPKENGYRSIHTAVIGPMGRTLEVQIRTRAMHREAELGVCAHWTYKGTEGSSLQSEKMNWLRQVLEWHHDLGEFASLDLDSPQERVYVSTPQGHVLDLSHGATAVDFAYRVHTEIGHRCRGAKVDGAVVPLNTSLQTGQTVEILTGESELPRREWLNPAYGFVKTARARDKIQSWFRAQIAESNVKAGRELLQDTFDRLEIEVDFQRLAEATTYETQDQLLIAIGIGECHVIDMVRVAGRLSESSRQMSFLDDDDDGRPTLQRLTIRGDDRAGLLRDVTAVLASLAIQVVTTHARALVASASAIISIEFNTTGMIELAQAIDQISRIPNVHDVRRD